MSLTPTGWLFGNCPYNRCLSRSPTQYRPPYTRCVTLPQLSRVLANITITHFAPMVFESAFVSILQLPLLERAILEFYKLPPLSAPAATPAAISATTTTASVVGTASKLRRLSVDNIPAHLILCIGQYATSIEYLQICVDTETTPAECDLIQLLTSLVKLKHFEFKSAKPVAHAEEIKHGNYTATKSVPTMTNKRLCVDGAAMTPTTTSLTMSSAALARCDAHMLKLSGISAFCFEL